MQRFAYLLIAAGLIPFGLSAARLMLRDGSVIYGRFVSGTPDQIVFQEDNGVRRRFDVRQVDNIDFNAATSANPYRGDNGADRFGSGRNAPYTNGEYPNGGYPNNGAYAVLPAGTEIMVRTDEDINAQNNIAGRTYWATIDRDVMDSSGRIAIPRGSNAQMVIRSVNAGDKLTGGDLVLDLDSVWVNGRRYQVSTAAIEQRNGAGIGANRRTGEYVGGGALLGTLLGAVAGGGKGAAIGAIAGAVGGGATQVLTRGHEIRVPAETQLDFRLEQPLQLNEMQ